MLACARCNGDEKREREWREFLGENCNDPAVLDQRRSLIQAWGDTHPQQHRAEWPAVEEALRVGNGTLGLRVAFTVAPAVQGPARPGPIRTP